MTAKKSRENRTTAGMTNKSLLGLRIQSSLSKNA
jgi:hypothetical protein